MNISSKHPVEEAKWLMAGFEKLPPLSLSQNDAHETHHSVFLRLWHLLQRYDLKYFIQFYRFKAWLIKYYPSIFVIQINKSFYLRGVLFSALTS